MTLAVFLSVAAIHLLAAMSPGPSFVVAVRTSVTNGCRQGMWFALGLGIGAAVWATAAMAGLALVFELAPALLWAFRICGAAFLIWLAISVWRKAEQPIPTGRTFETTKSPAAVVRQGILTQLANPKPAVFFGAVFVGLIPPGTSPVWLVALVLTILVNETLWYVVIARLFSAKRARDTYNGAKRSLERVFAGLIGAFGLRVALG